MSGERNEVQVVIGPQVLVAIGQEQHAFGRQCLDGTLIVGHQNDGTLVAAQSREDFPAGSRVEVVGRFVQE